MATEPTDLTPMPVGAVAEHALRDGSGLIESVAGYGGGSYDSRSGILTLTFERGKDEPLDPDDDDLNHGSAEYRFKLIPDITGEAGQ